MVPKRCQRGYEMMDQEHSADPIRDAIHNAIASKNWELARAKLTDLSRSTERDIAAEQDGLRHTIETQLVNEVDWVASASRWKEALLGYSDEPTLWPFAARAFIQSAHFEEADEILARLCEHQPDNFENWMYFALNAESRHLWAVAVERWDTVLRLNPDDSNIKMLRGDAYWNAEMQSIDEAMSLMPSSADRISVV